MDPQRLPDTSMLDASAAILAKLSDQDVFVLAMQMGDGLPANLGRMSHEAAFLQAEDTARDAWHGHILRAKDAVPMMVSHLEEGQYPRTFQELLGFLAGDEQWLGETLLLDAKVEAVASAVCQSEGLARAAALNLARETLGFTVQELATT